MTSPDITPYVDLTLFDRSIQGIFQAALETAATKLPGWVPREGLTEVVLLEAQAVEISELVFAVNRVPGAVIEVLLRMFGLSPDVGAPAVATVRFTAADSLGHEVLAGTRLRVSLGSGVEPVEFTTDVGFVIPSGSNNAVVAVTATEGGQRAHGGQVGGGLELLDSLAFINTVVFVTAPAGGREAEDSVAFLDRGVLRLRRLVTTLVLPHHFTTAALEHPEITRATTLDNYNSDAGSGAVGSHPGHVTVAIAGAGGAVVPTALKTTLLAEFEAGSASMLAVHITNPTITAVPVTVTVAKLAGFTNAQVIANVTAVLDAYLNPDAWAWSATVRRNELIARIDNAVGVDYVETLTAPAANVALAGVAPLADLGAVSVTIL